MALKMILEEREVFDRDEDEEISETEDHISEVSQSESNFDDDILDEDFVPTILKSRKRSGFLHCARSTIGPAGRTILKPQKRSGFLRGAQSAIGPAGRTGKEKGKAKEVFLWSAWLKARSSREKLSQLLDRLLRRKFLARSSCLSKAGDISWSSCPSKQPPRLSANVITMEPGPTRMAISHVTDIRSTFHLLMPDSILQIILDCTNREGRRVYGEKWKVMDMILMYAYLGLLYLAGVFKSNGESLHSLWSAETGREIFRATMFLDKFQIISRVFQFDNRDDRPARRQTDKLAAIRTVWDKWVHRPPPLFNPGPNVTVDEQLMPFRGRCPFRQYMPSKPAKYGIKFTAACDAATSYAWNLQVYTGKPEGGVPERNQAMRVVLDLCEKLKGHNITCDNFFTSYKLRQELLKRKLTMVGTIRKNKPELPPQLLQTKDRPINSSMFMYTADTSLVSCVPRKGMNVLLMSTLHRDGTICGQKPQIILDYNATKGGVDNIDKLVTAYTCKRSWPQVIFSDMLDISAYNAFVLWLGVNPHWNYHKLQRRRFFMEELGKALVTPYIQTRQHIPRTPSSVAIVRRIQGEDASGPSTRPTGPQPPVPEVAAKTTTIVWTQDGEEDTVW
uniref:LOW QUALITY PROTEIN: piggyBac transposable element-derived protein 4-like n=1 Tax=Monopterus albus TaxID=43700 RepID=UPI0009B2F8B0|nr:LOW QUALITY PROTEIN: piggyBac transposable element-derived protein 4-like [Monopterus albus]